MLKRTCRTISISLYFLACIVLPMTLLLSITAPLLQFCNQRREMENIDSPPTIDPRFIFALRQKGTDHFDEDMLTDNNIARQTNGVPGIILTIQQTLRAKRGISAEQQVRLPFIMSAPFLSRSPQRMLSGGPSRAVSLPGIRSV